MAAIAGQMGSLLLTGKLRRFATCVGLESGAMRAVYHHVRRGEALEKRPGLFKKLPRCI